VILANEEVSLRKLIAVAYFKKVSKIFLKNEDEKYNYVH